MGARGDPYIRVATALSKHVGKGKSVSRVNSDRCSPFFDQPNLIAPQQVGTELVRRKDQLTLLAWPHESRNSRSSLRQLTKRIFEFVNPECWLFPAQYRMAIDSGNVNALSDSCSRKKLVSTVLWTVTALRTRRHHHRAARHEKHPASSKVCFRRSCRSADLRSLREPCLVPETCPEERSCSKYLKWCRRQPRPTAEMHHRGQSAEA